MRRRRRQRTDQGVGSGVGAGGVIWSGGVPIGSEAGLVIPPPLDPNVTQRRQAQPVPRMYPSLHTRATNGGRMVAREPLLPLKRGRI
jgi:hypothetical protein